MGLSPVSLGVSGISCPQRVFVPPWSELGKRFVLGSLDYSYNECLTTGV